MPERLRFEDEDDNSAVEAAKRGYSAADSLNRAAESSAKRQTEARSQERVCGEKA